MSGHVCKTCSAPGPVHPRKGLAPLHRKRCRIPLRWGLERPFLRASTGDLSVHGMFVTTRRPAEPGSALRLDVEIAGTTARLDAVVMWTRRAPDGGLPSGMGLRLVHPPPAYADFVTALPT
jgi:uncharacterized protein (TIGR02266 family)